MNQSIATEIKTAALSARGRLVSVSILFFFMMLHQADKMVVSSLATPIMEAFHINEAQMGLALTGAIIVGAICYPLWGYLYDRYARPKILALAALVWSATTWLGAIAPTFPTFVATRASTGIDDASYPGIYSLISDYYPPARRGRVVGVLQLSMVLGPILGMGLATALRPTLGWRGVFYITAALGIVAAVAIYFGIKDAPRGQTEPEMVGAASGQSSTFTWQTVRLLAQKRSFIFLFIQQFIYVFPFNAISFWYYRYLETERALTPDKLMLTIGVFGIMGAVGSAVAGILGDVAFRRTPRGRIWVSIGGVVMLLAFFTTALRLPNSDFTLFFALQTVGSFFSGFVYPNATTTVNDVAEPEIRSTAHALIGIASTAGSAVAPLVTGILAVGSSLQLAMLRITTTGWFIGLLLLAAVAVLLPKDVHTLREEMKLRASAQNIPPA
jgi:MFS transporter, Spinster family, sphingosine-1-phosphate transporter